MSLRQPGRAALRRVRVCAPASPRPRHTRLKIGAAYPESMEAQPPLTCWNQGPPAGDLKVYWDAKHATPKLPKSKVGSSAECLPGDAHTDRLTSTGRNDIAVWRKLARRPPLLFECWSRSRNGSSSRNSSNRGVTALHPTPTRHPPPASQGQDGTVGGHQPGHGCHAGMGVPRRLAST